MWLFSVETLLQNLLYLFSFIVLFRLVDQKCEGKKGSFHSYYPNISGLLCPNREQSLNTISTILYHTILYLFKS